MPVKTSFKLCNKQHGFTLFELVVVVLLVGVFMIFAIDRMLRIQIDAERVSVQQTVAALKSAISLQTAELVVSKGLASIATLNHTNPMNYLQELPYNYLGMKNDHQASQYPAASWYYDPQLNVLVYTVKNHNYFVSSVAGTPRIRLKIEMVYQDEIRRGDKIRGVNLKSIDDYFWKYD